MTQGLKTLMRSVKASGAGATALFLIMSFTNASAPANPMAHYDFNVEDGGLFFEKTGTADNARLCGSVGVGTGVVGQAASFPGEGKAYLKIEDTGRLDLSHFSIEAWIKIHPDTVPYSGLICKRAGETADTVNFKNDTFSLFLSMGKLRLMVGSGKQTFSIDGKRPLTDNQWHYVVAIDDGESLKLYVDGAIDGEKKVAAHDAALTHGPLIIGYMPDLVDAKRSACMKGYVDELRIYNVGLDGEQIRLNYEKYIGHKYVEPERKFKPVGSASDYLKSEKSIACAHRPVVTSAMDKITMYEPVADSPAFAPQQEEIQRGYVAFSRNYLDLIYANSMPERKEIVSELSASAALGEYEPISFCIYSLKDLTSLKVERNDLLGDAGCRIDKENVTVMEVQHLLKRVTGDKAQKAVLLPVFLKRQAQADLKANQLRQYWITVYVPKEAHPGEYQGSLSIIMENAQNMQLKLKIHVRPYELHNPHQTIGMSYFLNPMKNSNGSLSTEPQKIDWEIVKKHLVDMQAHGMNSLDIHGGWFKPGTKEIDLAPLFKLLYFAKAAGLRNPMPWYFGNVCPMDTWSFEKVEDLDDATWNKTLTAIASVRDHVSANNLPEVLFYAGDEPYYKTKEIMLGRIYRLIKEKVSGVRTYMTVKPKYKDIYPSVDVRVYGWKSGYDVNSVLDETHKAGAAFWVYNPMGINHNPAFGRFALGFHLWNLGADGVMDWHYNAYYGNPFDDFDGAHSEWCATYPMSDGDILPSLRWEAMREGVDDLKYITTLEDILVECYKINGLKSNEDVVESEKILAEIRRLVPRDPLSYKFDDFETGEPLFAPPVWGTAKYDETRTRIADKIERLMRLLAHSK